MADLIVRDALKSEIKPIAGLLLEDRVNDPLFYRFTRSALQRWLYGNFLLPRYLGKAAHTWVLEHNGDFAGYAVVEQRGVAIHIAQISVKPGGDQEGFVRAVLERAEEMAREGDYRFLRAAPADHSEAGLASYLQAGMELMDYYLYCYRGTLGGFAPPPGVTMQQIALNKALERRLFYLRLELDWSAAAGRELIESAFLPRKPPSQRAFEIEYADEASGFLLPRPNDRGDGVLTLVLSLQPVHWGTELEAQIVAGFASAAGARTERSERKGKPVPTRLLISTTAHCEKADAALAAVGLTRQLDDHPVLFKAI